MMLNSVRAPFSRLLRFLPLPFLAFSALAQQPASAPARSAFLKQMQHDAQALQPFVKTAWVHEFLDAAADLPSIAPRTIYFDESRTNFYSAAAYQKLEEDKRAKLQKRELNESFYYNTRYGSPLAYARALDVLGQNGVNDIAGKKILDFGYGTIGHLRLLAGLGADVTGVEVDPLLPVYYGEPGDTGVIKGRAGRDGRVTLVHGQWPADEAVKKNAGDGYDLFISKNTLKNGYLHPAQPVDPKRLVHLGVSDEEFVGALFALLKPGGRVLIYNLCPAPAPPDKPYIPWADGRCPFPKETWEKAGFRVVLFDQNDDAAAREMGHLLGWDQGDSPMSLEKDLFGTYTLIEKPVKK